MSTVLQSNLNEKLNAQREQAGDSQSSLAISMLITAILYVLLASGSIYLSRQPGNIETLWYANTVGVVCLQLRSTRDWSLLISVVALSDLLANLVMGSTLLLTLTTIPENVFEVWLGAMLVRRFCSIPASVKNASEILKVLLLGGVMPALIGSLFGASMLSANSIGKYGAIWFSWFQGSALGAVSVLPLGMLLLVHRWRYILLQLIRPKVLTSLLVAFIVALWAPTYLPYPYVYVSVTLVLVATVGKFPATAFGVLVTSVTIGSLIAFGIFQPPSTVGNYHQLLFYFPLMLLLVPPLLLSATLERVAESIKLLAEREVSFRNLYLKTPVMMHSMDLSGRIVSTSDAWLKRLGYTQEEVVGRKTTDFLTPASRKYAEETVLPQLFQDGQVNNIDYQMLTKTGELVDVLLSGIWEHDTDGKPSRTLAVLKDVTEEKLLSAQLEAEQELILVTLKSIGDGVVTTDKNGQVSYLNPIAEQMVGWVLSEAKGLPFAEVVQLYDENSGVRLASPVEKFLQNQIYNSTENLVLCNKIGVEYGVQNSIAPIFAHNGSLLGSVMVFQDVTESRNLAQKMTYLAHHDGLTNLPNRVLLQDRIKQACQHGLRNNKRFAVIFMDLDHFKHANDSLGHAIGDALLKTVAARLTETLRKSDTVCRLGGDEFVMLVTELNSVKEAEEIALKILSEVAKPCGLSGNNVNVSISLGVAVYPKDGKDMDTLMKNADTAMYISKRLGRNQCNLFSKSMEQAA